MSKIAFFCIPAHGHTNPTLAVVKELVRRGNEVRYYSYDSLKEKNIPLFGGSAGSYISKDNAKISYNGKVYTESTAYIFIYGDIDRKSVV